MTKNDYRSILFLILIALVIFYPVFYTCYFYSDEVLQLRLYRIDPTFNMFVPQGRGIMNFFCRSLYGSMDYIHQLIWLRVFGLVTGLLCLPVWYSILRRVCQQEGLPGILPFFSVLYLVTSLPFSISIQWGACMELSIANTMGLLSGYFFYRSIRLENGRVHVGGSRVALSLVCGLLVLFTYQNGIGCFLLPFFLQLVARQKPGRDSYSGMFFYLAICFIYFLLFKAQLHWLHLGASDRTATMSNPLDKIAYFLGRVLPAVFHFNIVGGQGIIWRIVFVVGGGACLFLNVLRRKDKAPFLFRWCRYAFWLGGGLLLMYLPSLMVSENYSSNRTLPALDMAVFMWVAYTLLMVAGSATWQRRVVIAVSVMLVACSCYNYRWVFLRPAVHEYAVMKAFIDEHYNGGIQSVDFVRAPEGSVRDRYKVRSSWDEFGFASSYFKWVPESLVKQLVFEKTGDRTLAEKLTVRSWESESEWRSAGAQHPVGSLWIDAGELLK